MDARAVDTLFGLLDAFLAERGKHGMRRIYDGYRDWADVDGRRREELVHRSIAEPGAEAAE